MFNKTNNHVVYLKNKDIARLRDGVGILEMLTAAIYFSVGLEITPTEELSAALKADLVKIDEKSVIITKHDAGSEIVYQLTPKSWFRRFFEPKVVITCRRLPDFRFHRVSRLPSVMEGNSIYIVRNGSIDSVRVYASNMDGSKFRELGDKTFLEDILNSAKKEIP